MNLEGKGEGISRRKFLSYLVGGVSSVIAVVVGAPLVGYFLSPAWKRKPPLLTPIAQVRDIPIDRPVFVTYEQRIRDGWYITTLSKGAWVVNRGGSRVTVFYPRCTHLNCPYYWDEEKQMFLCPCHGGRFDIDGEVLASPPPRPLDRLEFSIEDGSISLSGRIIREG